MAADPSWLEDHIRDIPDYPRTGVTFRDITPLLADADAFRFASTPSPTASPASPIDRVVGIEARGFILAAPVAYRLGASFVPVRKAGKLPWAVAREEYSLEYGTDKLEIHRDAVHPGRAGADRRRRARHRRHGQRRARLVEGLGGEVVGLGFVIELGLAWAGSLEGCEVEQPEPTTSARATC